MRRMRAEQIRYRFGRNFLSFRGMRCFNLIRYGTYRRIWKHSGDRWRIAGHPCSAPTSPPFPSRPSSPWSLLFVPCVTVLGKLGWWFTVRLTPCPQRGTCFAGADQKGCCWEQTSRETFYKNDFYWRNLKWDKQVLRGGWRGMLLSGSETVSSGCVCVCFSADIKPGGGKSKPISWLHSSAEESLQQQRQQQA